jgi:GNAT superfamily N-acetyltransferase
VSGEHLVVAKETFSSPGPQSIVLAALDEFDRLYGEGNRGANDLGAHDFDPPRGLYLVGRDDAGHLVGGVGLRPIAEPAARFGEIKRLWVRPDQRRHGAARRLMEVVLGEAVERNYAALYLETGPRQPAARALYTRLGWEPIESYPDGAHSHDTGFRFRLVLT